MITRDMILEAAGRNAKHAALPTEVRKIADDFIGNLPEVLKELLEEKVTLESIIAAKKKCNEYLLQKGYFGKIVLAMPPQYLRGMTYQEAVRMFEGLASANIMILATLVNNIQFFLASHNITAREVLEIFVGLEPCALALYDTGEMTIADLLGIQPTAIFRE